MSTSLETFLSSELTPLQQAALDKIVEFKHKLAGVGIYLRTAMELEFTTEDGKTHVPQPNLIHRNVSLQYLRKALGNSVEDINYESIKEGRFGAGEPVIPYQYEAKISETGSYSTQFAPEKIAGMVALMKKKTLAEMLLETTCLTTFGNRLAHPFLIPNFKARPYYKEANRHPQIEHSENVTSAIHINLSLYNERNINLFTSTPSLLHSCAKSLVEMQKNGLLPMFPSEDSLLRVNEANNSAPAGLGIGTDKKRGNAGDRKISVNIRDADAFPKPEAGLASQTRLEIRLPGADADPLVAMAVTLAGVVDAVERPIPHDIGTYDITKKHEELVQRFESDARLKELLGGRLHQLILQEYQSGKAPDTLR